MRDIRSDLQERLDAVGRDREDLQRRISEMDLIETSIRALLKRESENFGFASPALVENDLGSFGAKDAMSVVKPGNWAELRVG